MRRIVRTMPSVRSGKLVVVELRGLDKHRAEIARAMLRRILRTCRGADDRGHFEAFAIALRRNCGWTVRCCRLRS